MNNETLPQYDEILNSCRAIFEKKNNDYGTSWRIMRTSSITDQIFIKAKRLQSIESAGKQLVEDKIEDDYIGIVNYCIIASIQIRLTGTEIEKDGTAMESSGNLLKTYDQIAAEIRDLMIKKNHDYGEAWRDMRLSTITDMMLMRLMRIKQIEDHDGKTEISEGIESNYYDLVNYAIFALIKLKY